MSKFFLIPAVGAVAMLFINPWELFWMLLYLPAFFGVAYLAEKYLGPKKMD